MRTLVMMLMAAGAGAALTWMAWVLLAPLPAGPRVRQAAGSMASGLLLAAIAWALITAAFALLDDAQ